MMPAEPVLTRIKVKNKSTVQKKESRGIPRNTKEPAAHSHQYEEGREIGRERSSHIHAKRQVPPAEEKINICNK
jgi:hypothetical protein